MKFTTPILFIVFNRLDTTKLVFERIRQMQPAYLFVAADGYRLDKMGEKEICSEVREYILSNIDWVCEVETLFQGENLGCGVGPATAITWFFDQVESGIILEDDCLPSTSFFYYCDNLLRKYKNDDNVMIISGYNPLGEIKGLKSDYFFSKQAGIWGWATWKRSWKGYNYLVPEWTNKKIQAQVLSTLNSDTDRGNMKFHLDKVISSKNISFWDYQWWFYRLLNNGIGIIPQKNLIKNVGFGKNATHTTYDDVYLSKLQSRNLKFPLKHPDRIEINEDYDNNYLEIVKKRSIIKKPLIKRIKGFIKRILISYEN